MDFILVKENLGQKYCFSLKQQNVVVVSKVKNSNCKVCKCMEYQCLCFAFFAFSLRPLR